MALEDKMDARMEAIHVKAFVSTINTAGDYNCTCPHGTYGDGRKNGKGCIKNNVEFPIIKATLGLSFSFLFLLVGISWLHLSIKKRKLIKLRRILPAKWRFVVATAISFT